MADSRRTVIALWPAKEAAVGNGKVLRALPRRELRRVGPFVFCDSFGPHPPDGMAVPPHPHVGLQTVTYLFSGAIRHADSIGSVQVIRPGEVNWMTAGRAIVHAERGLAEGGPIQGLQTWVGLPQAQRKMEPAFTHVGREAIPLIATESGRVRVLAGRIGEAVSPTPTFQPLTYLDVEIDAGGEVTVPVEAEHELAAFSAIGDAEIGGTLVASGVLAHLSRSETTLTIKSAAGARCMVLGGTPLPEPTVIWWNFIVDSVDEGKARHSDWIGERFPKLPGDW